MADLAFQLDEVEGLGSWGCGSGVVGENVGPYHLAEFGGESEEWGLGLGVYRWVYGGGTAGGFWGADGTRVNQVSDSVAPAMTGWVVVPDRVGVAEDPGIEMAHVESEGKTQRRERGEKTGSSISTNGQLLLTSRHFQLRRLQPNDVGVHWRFGDGRVTNMKMWH